MSDITVLDYGIGNIFSICNAFDHFGVKVKLGSSKTDIANSQRLVLPGVGAFKDGMASLQRAGLLTSVLAYADSGRPILGICLGMQMMLTRSEEFGSHEGLNLISGHVSKIPDRSKQGVIHKVPHIGWNGIHPPPNDPTRWSGSILQDLEPGNTVYFVHSFQAVPDDKDALLAVASYNGVQITAAVQKGNVIGCQFHPEKSGRNGLSIYKRFLELEYDS